MKKFFVSLLFLFTFFFVTHPIHAQEIITDKKLITVDIGKQMLYAWDGGKIQYQSPVSTGMRYTPTLPGTFKVRAKVLKQDMKGRYPPYEPYHIKDVPHVLYYSGAYAIHGAHWHNKFGSRVTHGCVNLPLAAAEWVYNWADVGTQVIIF